MKKHITSKKAFFALTLCVSFAHPMLILSAASSSSSSGSCDTRKTEMTLYYAATSTCAIEPQEEVTGAELQQRLATLRALLINPFLAQRKPKSLAEIAHGFAQRTLQEYEYAALNRKYLLPKEEPAKCMEGITGRFSLRYKVIGKLFQEHQEDKLSFEDLFAIAQQQNSLAQLASFVYFALHKETTWNDTTLWYDNKFIGPWERKMRDYPKELLPYLGITLEEYIAYNKAHKIIALQSPITGNRLELTKGHLASLDGIEAIPGIEGVKSIYLGSNKLSDLPYSISDLRELKCLDLTNNQLTTLPYSISNLTKLKHLWLSDNQLTALPDFIGNTTQLKCLDLANNKLIALPGSLCNLRELKCLVLTNNQLTTLPSLIGNLTNLEDLVLLNNQLTALPDSVCNLTNLKFLNLNNNKLTALPDSICNLRNLENLLLHANNFSETERNRITLMINQATAGQCKILW